MTVRMNML